MYLIPVFLVSLLLNLLFLHLSKRYKICLDISFKRHRVHNKVIPRIGGLPIFLTYSIFNIFNLNILALKLLFASLPAFAGGFLDDLTQRISYKYRFLFITISSTIFLFLVQNAVITDLYFFKIPYIFGVLFTLIALTGITNAFNIIDGINGLSSGIALINLIFFALIAYNYSYNELFQTLLIAIGALLGFFLLNYLFGIIFLGDSGSYFLGFFIGSTAIILVNKLSISPWYPIVLAFYPIWETLFSIARRLKNKKNPFTPDKAHLHHLLLKFFRNNHLKVSSSIIIFQLFFSLIAFRIHTNSIGLIVLVLLMIFIYLLLYHIIFGYVNRKEVY